MFFKKIFSHPDRLHDDFKTIGELYYPKREKVAIPLQRHPARMLFMMEPGWVEATV